MWLATLLRLLLEEAVVVDILEKEDLTDMGLLSGTGNFLVNEAGDLVSESPEIIGHYSIHSLLSLV